MIANKKEEVLSKINQALATTYITSLELTKLKEEIEKRVTLKIIK